jgi:cytochrome c peroxidase
MARSWRIRSAALLLGCAGLAAVASGGGVGKTDAARPPPNKQAFVWTLPPGFPEPAVPADNPMSGAKVALGAELFRDPRLSVTGRYSCQSCHAPERAFTDGLALSRGATGATIPLNAPTLLNVAYSPALGWRAPGTATLEAQMRGPLFNEHPPELGLAGREREVEALLARDVGLAARFAAAFPEADEPVTLDNVIHAIAAFERTLIGGRSAFDRYVFAGEHDALDATRKQGLALFFSESVGCSRCHGGLNFTGAWADREHPEAAASYADNGNGLRLRVPTLRNLTRTAPYMHDGRFATLDAVLDHYEAEARDPDSPLARPPLTTQERHALRVFLESLSDDLTL